ncbi:hypothetical protein HanPSC8_Chr01g0004081 [Helianthus annuus]|nr:hypothetical protein HanPSC8_Chr01g0004081 [Helianthus annuus]
MLFVNHVIKRTNKDVQWVGGEHGSYVQIRTHKVSKLPNFIFNSNGINCMIIIKGYVEILLLKTISNE